MKAIMILTRCRNAERDERRIRQQIAQRREAMESVTPNMDAVGGGHGSAQSDKMAALVAQIDELERELKQRQKEHRVEVVAGCTLLDRLPEGESAVLHKYYLMREKVEAIANGLGYTAGYVRNLKSDGERLLQNMPDNVVDALLPDWYGRNPCTSA